MDLCGCIFCACVHLCVWGFTVWLCNAMRVMNARRACPLVCVHACVLIHARACLFVCMRVYLCVILCQTRNTKNDWFTILGFFLGFVSHVNAVNSKIPKFCRQGSFFLNHWLRSLYPSGTVQV